MVVHVHGGAHTSLGDVRGLVQTALFFALESAVRCQASLALYLHSAVIHVSCLEVT
jgi:hypothetical protein